MKALSLIFLFLSVAAFAQQLEPLPPVDLADFVNRKPQLCEDRSAMLDVITQRTPPDETITVIAHESTSESRPDLNHRRLHNVRAYWTQFLEPQWRRKPETIILSKGERVQGYGRLEFLVRGKLVSVLNVAHNADVDFADCVPPDESYIRHGVFNPCWIKSHRIFYPCRTTLAANPFHAQTPRTKLRLPCQYKSISVPTDNAANQRLSYTFDLKQIASIMRQKPIYEVSDHFNGDGILVSRTFGGVKYNIVFENRDGAGGFNLNTYNFKGYPGLATSAWGEKCTKPSYLIKRNVYRMIDDLPLDTQQKAELKKYVVVARTINGRIF